MGRGYRWMYRATGLPGWMRGRGWGWGWGPGWGYDAGPWLRSWGILAWPLGSRPNR